MTYEILTIAYPEISEKAQKDLSQKIQDLVKKEKGKPVSEENLGTKKLATPAKNQETGTYFSVVAELKPDSIKGIKKSLKSNAGIINVYIFKIAEAKKEKAKKPKKIKSKKEKTTTAPELTKKAKTKKIIAKPKKVFKKKPQKIKPEKKPIIATEIEGEEDRLKKLDDKLDEILKE